MRVIHGDDNLYLLKFEEPFMFTANDRAAFTARCKKALLKYTNDGKMNNTMLGVASCSVKDPCPYCIRPSGEDTTPKWVEDVLPRVNEEQSGGEPT